MYKTIKDLEEKKLLKKLVKEGIISITILGHKQIYEAFLKEKSKGIGTTQAITNVSLETRTPESTIYKIIRRMKKGENETAKL